MPIQFTPRKPAPSMLPPITERLAVSRREAATMLGISERSLDNWTKAGKITARKIGTRVLYSVQSLQEFLNVDSTGEVVHD